MSLVTTYLELPIPDDAKVGDEFSFTATARVTAIREETVDVSSIDKERYLSGDTTYELRVFNAAII